MEATLPFIFFCLFSHEQILSFKSTCMPNFARAKKQEIPKVISHCKNSGKHEGDRKKLQQQDLSQGQDSLPDSALPIT